MDPLTFPDQDLPELDELLSLANISPADLSDIAADNGWTWDEGAGGYVDADGNAVPQDVVNEALVNAVANADGELARTTDQLLEDEDVGAWELSTAAILALLLLAAYGLGRGGGGAMQDDDYSFVQDRLTTQFGFLRGFSEALLGGALTEAAMRSRLELYTQDDRVAYWQGFDAAHGEGDWPYYRSVLGGCDHCTECPEEASKGWVPRGELVPIGERICKWRCCCSIEYGGPDVRNSILDNGWGWLGTYPRATPSATEMEIVRPDLQPLTELDRQALSDILSAMPEAEMRDLFCASVARCPDLAKELNRQFNQRQVIQGQVPEVVGYMGVPTDVMMAAISQALPPSVSRDAGEWFTVDFRASDNLISYSRRRWHPNVLAQMSDRARGHLMKPLITDHEWEANNAMGFIYDQALMRDAIAPADKLNAAGYQEYNEAIVSGEGYTWLWVAAAIHGKREMAIERFQSRLYQDVSTGGLLYQPRWICPNCTATHGREVSFYEQELDERGQLQFVCPHYAPWDLDDVGEEYADYAILDGLYSATELSVCTEGNLPAAGVL